MRDFVRLFWVALGAIGSICIAQSAQARPIEISISLSKHTLVYESETGELAIKDPRSKTLRLVPNLKLPKNLKEEHFTASTDFNQKNSNLVLLRHGARVSVFDAMTGRISIANFGPVVAHPIPWMSFDTKLNAVSFPGESLMPNSASRNLLTVFKSGNLLETTQPDETKNVELKQVPTKFEIENASFGAPGQDREISYSYKIGDAVGAFAIRGFKTRTAYYTAGYSIHTGEVIEKDESDLEFPESVRRIFNGAGLQDAGRWTVLRSGDLIATRAELKDRQKRAFEKHAYSEAIRLVDMSIGEKAIRQLAEIDRRLLLSAAQQAVVKEKNELAQIKVNLADQRRFGTELKAALSDAVIGQPEAIESLVNVAQRQVTEKKSRRPMLLLAGTTGTGKTSGFTQFIKKMFPNSESPLLSIDMTQMQEPEFMTTELFGSSPGYIGSESVTKLMIWLIENPDGGGLLFDEIDKTPMEVLRVLQTFLEKGEITIRPDVVAALVAAYEDVPKEEWPAVLREKTKDGEKTNTSFVLKLTPRHFIAMATNAGSEVFTGAGNSSLTGKRLVSDQEIEAANALFTEEKVIASLKARGFLDDLLNRITDVIPFKVLTRTSLQTIYAKELGELQIEMFENYRLKAKISSSFVSDFTEQFYQPLQGARYVLRNVHRWVGDQLRRRVIAKEIPINSTLDLDFKRGVDREKPELIGRIVGNAGGAGKELRFQIGDPVDLGPVDLLARAQARLWPALQAGVFGHEPELRLIYQNIIAQLVRSVKDPASSAKPVVLYVDGTSGIGKTEIAKVVAAVLFDDADGLTKIPMNLINDLHSFDQLFVKPLTQAIRTNSQYLVALLDELPRAGAAHEAAQTQIHNSLYSIIDEATLPAVAGEYRIVNGHPRQVSEVTKLPAATVFIATGNLLLDVIESSHDLTHEELQKEVQELKKNPDKFDRAYESTFGPALRGRLGEPIVMSPLVRSDLHKVLHKIWLEQVKVLAEDGYHVELSPAAERALIDNSPASVGSRNVKTQMLQGISNPLIAIVHSGDSGILPGKIVVEVYKNEADETIEFKAHTTAGLKSLSVQRAAMLFKYSKGRSGGIGFMTNTQVPGREHVVLPARTCEGIFVSVLH